MDGEGLRLIVPRKLRDGRLPHDRFTVVWSGPSDGKTCDACDVLLTEQHVLMERTRGRKTPPAYFHVHRFWGLGSRTARRLMDAEPSAISSGKSSTMADCRVAALRERSDVRGTGKGARPARELCRRLCT